MSTVSPASPGSPDAHRPRDAGDRQVVPGRPRPQVSRPDRPTRRDRRAGRRERGRQVHADEDPVRRLHAGHGRDPCRRGSRRGGRTTGHDPARPRGDLPGAGTRPAPERGGEHLHGPAADHSTRSRRPASARSRTPWSSPSGSAWTWTRGHAWHRSAWRVARWSRSPRRYPATRASSSSTSRRQCWRTPSCDGLFRVMRRLTEKGVAFIYISHRLNEVFRITDRVVVMKDGRVVASEPTADVTPDAPHPADGRARDRCDLWRREAALPGPDRGADPGRPRPAPRRRLRTTSTSGRARRDPRHRGSRRVRPDGGPARHPRRRPDRRRHHRDRRSSRSASARRATRSPSASAC